MDGGFRLHPGKGAVRVSGYLDPYNHYQDEAMPTSKRDGGWGVQAVAVVLGFAVCSGVVWAVIFKMTLDDFRVPGTQVGDIDPVVIRTSDQCAMCHGNFDLQNDPAATWSGSKMALAGKNPLFFAQMTLANQDVANVGNYCMRCHVPISVPTGNVNIADGSALDSRDLEGVSCHFCHSMVDPVYKPGISPVEDEAILAALDEVPTFYGNAMFVLDPEGRRRGPREGIYPPHELLRSPFHTKSEFCGTCHDVGNVATTRQPDGTFIYNAIGQPSPTQDPHEMFPLERTYTEWKLSAFASGGVDMGGRFGGLGAGVIESCQDCHMPKAQAQACVFSEERDDTRRHEFAGAGAQVLDLIALHSRNDPTVDQDAVDRARAAAVSMLERAATLEGEQSGGWLVARVVNESGHKLPTGHIEGRRVWVNTRFLDGAGGLISEVGGYDFDHAELDEEGAAIFEMRVGLSDGAAALTGLPAGETSHMALADTIVKDTRIPPRGWNNQAFTDGGAPAVGIHYPDGQYWHDSWYTIPAGARTAEVRVYYQNTPRWYIEHLREANHTDHWGETLYGLWEQTERGEPILMSSTSVELHCLADTAAPFGVIDFFDIPPFLTAYAAREDSADLAEPRGVWDASDVLRFIEHFTAGCP